MARSSLKRQRISRWRPFLWRWHRRCGVLAAVILVMVAITGILLNHTVQLALAKQPVRSTLLLSLYGVEFPRLISFTTGAGWLSADAHGYLYLNGQRVHRCDGALTGVVVLQELIVAACSEELALLNLRGEVVERLSADYGLPTPIERAGKCQQRLCFEAAERTLQADLDGLQWMVWTQGVNWSKAAELPDDLHDKLIAEAMGTELSWERVVLDLHSGRLGGPVGVWLVDAAALIMIFLSGSGFWLWWQHFRRHRAPR